MFSRPRTQHDLVRMFAQAMGSTFDSARRCQTPKTALDFSDTEEVTGSNPVRPTSSEAYPRLCDRSPARMTAKVTATVTPDRFRKAR